MLCVGKQVWGSQSWPWWSLAHFAGGGEGCLPAQPEVPGQPAALAPLSSSRYPPYHLCF